MYCKICGDESSTYRVRSGMSLCDSCHQETPAKVSFSTFLDATFRTDPGWKGTGPDMRVAQMFYEDYQASKYASPAQYWDACSSTL